MWGVLTNDLQRTKSRTTITDTSGFQYLDLPLLTLIIPLRLEESVHTPSTLSGT